MVKFIVINRKKRCLLEFSFPCPYLWQEIVNLSKLLETRDQKKIIVSQMGRLMPKEYCGYDGFKWWFFNNIPNVEQGFLWFRTCMSCRRCSFPLLRQKWTERLIVPNRQNERIVKHSWINSYGQREFSYYPFRFSKTLKNGKLSKRFCDALPY